MTNCDPVIVNALGLTKVDVTNVPTAEHVVTVMNGNPGLATVTVKVNGKQFVMSSLKAGETPQHRHRLCAVAGRQERHLAVRHRVLEGHRNS